nr:PREDICTED: E3 ubiquitin protein ligase DRIP1 isoform X2 [Raphanus sativus]
MVSQAKRDTMRARLSCPICDSILLDATTISECLHTFCRKCIYEKITEEEIEGCPVCNIDLGGTPLDKLRPDHNLQDLRAKIFPVKGRKVPARRKERSMSSLVVTKRKVSDQAGRRRRRRTKTVTRKELRESTEEESLKGDLLESTSSPGTLDQNKKQVNKDSDEPWDDESYWKTLNFLVEVANRTNTLKPSAFSQGSGSKPEEASASHKQVQPKVKDHKSKCSRREDEKSDHTTSETTTTPKRLPRTQRKRPSSTTSGPVWFSLVSSTDQEGKTSLPQIPANFLRYSSFFYPEVPNEEARSTE